MARLVLSRRLDEEIYIGSDIKVTVVEIDRGKVRLAFDAPSDVPIYRKEVYERMKEQSQDNTQR